MSRINLLPWREELRKIQNRIFFTISVGSVLAAVIVIVIIHWLISYRTGIERANIEYLNKELQGIMNQISQIQGLQENKENLLNRMRIIQALQEDRSSVVKLLDIIPKVVPDSVYLTSITRTEPEIAARTGGASAAYPNPPAVQGVSGGNPEPKPASALEKIKEGVGLNNPEKKAILINKEYLVEILGVAQTNSGISNLMKNLQEIPWVSNIKYSEVSVNKTGEGLNFKLEFSQKIGHIGAKVKQNNPTIEERK
jgi:type IV pilus assembly protein PilN